MDRIASPQDLQAEIRAIQAFVHASEKPDRQVVAAKLRDLADRVAGRGPFDTMLDALQPPGGLDWAKIKIFAVAFAKHLRSSRLSPQDVQNAARAAADDVGSPTDRVFNVSAMQLGKLVQKGWREAQSQGKGFEFLEGFKETLGDKAPMRDSEWTDAIEFALGFAGIY